MTEPSSIPEGFTTVTTYITCDNTEEVIAFYQRAFGAEEVMRLPKPGGGVMYAEITIGSTLLMLGDCSEEWGGKSAKALGGSPVSFYIYVSDVAAAMQKAMDAGAQKRMEPEDMFWGDRIGSVLDPFGYEWTVAQKMRDVSPEEIEQAMKQMAA